MEHKVEIFPLVFGALGALPDKSVTNFELLQLTEVNVLMKTVLLRTDVKKTSFTLKYE